MGTDLRALLHAGEATGGSVVAGEEMLEQFAQAFQQAAEQVSVIHAVLHAVP